MLEEYSDIRKRIAVPPRWFDCHGVPRYDTFHPRLSPNVYADEVVLFEIGCQGCRQRFRVEANYGLFDRAGQASLKKQILSKKLHYGDPPIHTDRDGQGCPGNCMGSVPLKVIRYWRRNHDKNRGSDWVRVPELEGRDIEGFWGAYPFSKRGKDPRIVARYQRKIAKDRERTMAKLRESHSG